MPVKPADPYRGINCVDTRDPLLESGVYRVRIVSGIDSTHPVTYKHTNKITLSVVAASAGAGSAVGTQAVALFQHSIPGFGELKNLVMHAAGFGPTLEQRQTPQAREIAMAGMAAFDQACDAQGSIVEASLGKANGAPNVLGRLVDVIVTRGKARLDKTGADTGDFYRQYTWGIVPEAEQA